MGVRGKVIRAAREARMTAGAVKRVTTTASGRMGGAMAIRGRRISSGVRSARRDIGTARRVSQVNPRIGSGVKSSRYLAGGLAIAYGGGAIINRRGPAADRVDGIRNTGMYGY